MDSGVLARVLDDVLAYGGDYRIDRLDVGRAHDDESYARIEVSASDDEALARLLMRLQTHGVNQVDPGEALLREVEQDGVFPDDFYSTTNLETVVRLGAVWVPVEQPEMDCGLVVEDGRVRTVPVSDVRAGQRVVCGAGGVKVVLPLVDHSAEEFGFMSSSVSSEKPQSLLLRQIAQQMREVKADGGKVLWVGGPAVVHTGAAPHLAELVRQGWIDILFAGNGFATHDIESNVLGTSLGVPLGDGLPPEGGHSNHLRVINEVRRRGSIAGAVADGYITGGVMFECVQHDVPFVLGGSVRDDGPLPDVLTDVVEAADAMRAQLPGVSVALMLASTLHAIATGNVLPAGVETYCVDINQAVVTKLADRGSHQALGIVTDVGLFVHTLAQHLL